MVPTISSNHSQLINTKAKKKQEEYILLYMQYGMGLLECISNTDKQEQQCV